MQLVVGLHALFCIPIREHSLQQPANGLNGVGAAAAPAIQFVAH